MIYNRSLDGLRGVAILLVLLFHYNFLVGFGWLGVQLFFVLSGYLISTILLNEKGNPIDFYLKRFYWRRTLRIFPLYYVYLFFIGIIFLISSIPKDFWELFPYLATYTFNFYPLINTYSYEDYFFMHFWSLSVEEQFYLIWPLVIFFCSRKQLQTILLGIIIGAPVIRYFLAEWMLSDGLQNHYVGETVYRFTLGQWDGFAFGALIPLYSLGERKLSVGKWLLLTLIIIIALGVFNLYQLYQTGNTPSFASLGYQIAELINYQQVWSYTLFDFFFFLLILYVVNSEKNEAPVTKALLSNSFMVYLGKISYGLYVYHWIIWMAFNKYLRSKFPLDILGFAVYLCVCLAVASISFYLFEQPILSFKNRFFNSVKSLPDEKIRTSF